MARGGRVRGGVNVALHREATRLGLIATYCPSSYSSRLLKIESASLVPVFTSFDKTLNCPLHAILLVGTG